MVYGLRRVHSLYINMEKKFWVITTFAFSKQTKELS
jgi:hypothetical protein